MICAHGVVPHGVTGTSRGLAFQLKPEYIRSCLPLPRSPAEQFNFLLMQLSVHIAMALLSHAPNQSACSVEPFGGAGNIASDDSSHLLVSSPSTIEYHAPITKVGMT